MTLSDLFHLCCEQQKQLDVPWHEHLNKTSRVRLKLSTQEDLIFCGGTPLDPILKVYSDLEWRWLFRPGDLVLREQSLLELNGSWASCRAVQNAVQTLVSGACAYSTALHLLSRQLEGTHIQFLSPITPPWLAPFSHVAVHSLPQTRVAQVNFEILDKDTVEALGGYTKAYQVGRKMNRSFAAECTQLSDIEEAQASGFSDLAVSVAIAEAARSLKSSARWTVMGPMSEKPLKEWMSPKVAFLKPNFNSGFAWAELAWSAV